MLISNSTLQRLLLLSHYIAPPVGSGAGLGTVAAMRQARAGVLVQTLKGTKDLTG